MSPFDLHVETHQCGVWKFGNIFFQRLIHDKYGSSGGVAPKDPITNFHNEGKQQFPPNHWKQARITNFTNQLEGGVTRSLGDENDHYGY